MDPKLQQFLPVLPLGVEAKDNMVPSDPISKESPVPWAGARHGVSALHPLRQLASLDFY